MVTKYYAYKDGEYLDGMDYDSIEDAMRIVERFDGDEIESHVWNNYEDWNECYPADKQTLVWKKGE